jgi:hypothetical protein
LLVADTENRVIERDSESGLLDGVVRSGALGCFRVGIVEEPRLHQTDALQRKKYGAGRTHQAEDRRAWPTRQGEPDHDQACRHRHERRARLARVRAVADRQRCEQEWTLEPTASKGTGGQHADQRQEHKRELIRQQNRAGAETGGSTGLVDPRPGADARQRRQADK